MFWIIVIALIAAVVIWCSYNIATKGKSQLKNVAACIDCIEKNPNSPGAYDKFIEVWKSSMWVQSTDLFNGGYYERILVICNTNSSNIKAWQVLAEVVQRISISFGIDVTGKRNKAITVRLLIDNLLKEFRNQPVKERILTLLDAVGGITQAETQELYNTSLKMLEASPNCQETKMLVLELGRFHYGTSRPDKRPTIYDEQAIQNDIIVRVR